MFTSVKILIFLCLIQQLQMMPLSDSGIMDPTASNKQLICWICEDEQQMPEDDDTMGTMNPETLFEYDKSMGTDSLDEIENDARLLNSTAWPREPIDVKNLKEALELFGALYENQSLEFREADKILEDLKLKMNIYTMEKEENKRSALKNWRRLPMIRLRVHKIEQRILDTDIFGESIEILEHIDQIRNLADEASKTLRDLYSYYHQMDEALLEGNNILKNIEEKLNVRREKEGKSRESHCFWFFCY